MLVTIGHSFSVEGIRVIQVYHVVNPSQVECFENHAEWRFCLASLWCVAPCRRSGAWWAQWRASALLLLSLFSPCVVHVRSSVDVHLDSCDRT